MSISFTNDGEWPLTLTRAREGDEDDILAVTLEALRHHDSNPVDESELIAPKTKKYLDEIWNQWLRFTARIKAHPEETWLALCLGSEEAKSRCRAFLESYVKTSTVMRPCLDPEEWCQVRTVNCAVTLEDVWAALVRNADTIVLKPKRLEKWSESQLWNLRYSSRMKDSCNSPAYEIGKSIPQIAKRLGLSLEQLFTKRETTPEDVLLMLDTLWTRSEDIRCTPDCRVAFHCSLLLAGIGGWRPASITNIRYEDVELAWVRDPFNPETTRLAAAITIRHVKQRKDRIQRAQRSVLQFSITTVPCRQLCLLTFLTARALADDAFDAGYTSPHEVLRDEPLAADYVPLPWKPEILSKGIIVPISYNTYWNIWNRTLFVAGLRDRDKMRPYAMRVGAGQRLDGSLTAPLRNYILSNSSEVYERSYLPKHLSTDLMKIAYQNRAGQNEEIISLMSRALVRRDPHAPIYITNDDLTRFETRKDLSSLRKQYGEARKSDPTKAQKIKERIKYLLDWLERLRLEKMRQEYFEKVDKLRAQGAPTEHLRTASCTNPRKQKAIVGAAVASRISTLLNNDIAPVAAAELLLAYLQGKPEGEVFPHQETDITRKPQLSTEKTRCLLCGRPYSNASSLTRHVRQHHENTFREPFNCPECHRAGKTCQINALPAAWSNHVRCFHGKKYTPNLWSSSTSLKLEERKRGRPLEDTIGTTSKKTRYGEDDYTMGDFREKWEQTPDPHAGEEFWVTGKGCDEDMPYSYTDEEGYD